MDLIHKLPTMLDLVHTLPTILIQKTIVAPEWVPSNKVARIAVRIIESVEEERCGGSEEIGCVLGDDVDLCTCVWVRRREAVVRDGQNVSLGRQEPPDATASAENAKSHSQGKVSGAM